MPHQINVGGLTWRGDQLFKVNRDPGFFEAMLENQWQSRLGLIDKFVLNYIMSPRLKRYGYSQSRARTLGLLLVPILILLPLSYERRFWSPSYILSRLRKGQIKTIAANGTNYLRRIRTFLKFYVKTATGKKYEQPILTPQFDQSPFPRAVE